MENMKISMSQITPITLILTYLEREKYDLNPIYQREGDIWNLRKRKLLIDSILNQFDIPKIYVHELENPEKIEGKIKYYGIIDGKQRLETIWQFIDNKWPLADEFEYYNDNSIKLNGLYYKDLAEKYPIVHAKFNGFPLTVIAVKTTDTDLIDDMFSRMNEAVPLNAPEKRNAKKGPIPIILRELVKHEFFENCLPINSKRYKHHDLACKFLLLEYSDGPTSTAKSYLDDFVDSYSKDVNAEKMSVDLKNRTVEVLDKMENVFGSKDLLLKNLGTDVVYYLIFRDAIKEKYLSKLKRDKFESFEKELEKNRVIYEEDARKADGELIEFINLHQSLNSVSAMNFKMKVLKKYLNL
jgi:hypothetical protein